MPKRKQPTVRLDLRLPPELHAALVPVAQSDRRSLNAELVTLLIEALERRGITIEPPGEQL